MTSVHEHTEDCACRTLSQPSTWHIVVRQTPREETRRVLEIAEVFWLSTVRADGRPHVTPVAAAWLDGILRFQTKIMASGKRYPC